MNLPPEIVVNLVTAAALGGGLWVGFGNIRKRLDDLSTKVQEQNSRVAKLERWRARREGWQNGWDQRAEQGGGEAESDPV